MNTASEILRELRDQLRPEDAAVLRAEPGTAEITATRITDPAWLAEQIRLRSLMWKVDDQRVLATLWWYSASTILVTPALASLVVTGTALSPALDDTVLHQTPSNRLTGSHSTAVPGPNLDRLGSTLEAALTSVITALSAFTEGRQRPLWAIATDAIANRLLWAGEAVGRVREATDLAAPIIAAAGHRLPPQGVPCMRASPGSQTPRRSAAGRTACACTPPARVTRPRTRGWPPPASSSRAARVCALPAACTVSSTVSSTSTSTSVAAYPEVAVVGRAGPGAPRECLAWHNALMDHSEVQRAVAAGWDESALPSLAAFVEIPALSPGFDASWAETGHLRAAVEHVREWIATRDLPGARSEIVELPGRSPLLMVDVPATSGVDTPQGTVILYGHLDKQPAVGEWSEGLEPWKPVIRDGRLYGRGAVDDGYSGYAATLALEAVRAAGGAHARAVLLLETGEESGSPDLPAYMELLAERLGEVSLVVCLDAGGGDYERLWLTNSLRGLAQVTVKVTVLDSAQHSGLASGIVPSSFRILRALLDRIEDAETGVIKLPAMNVEIPADRRAEAEKLAKSDPGAPRRQHPLHPGVRPVSDDDVELILNNTWRPTLSVTGASGLPEPASAGNVLRTSTSLKLSFRLPPTADSQAVLAELKQALTTDVPYNAKVELADVIAQDGWNAPALSPWLSEALDSLGDSVLGERHQSIGIGGAIPFMTMLAERYPQAQFLVTGALGVDSNMHVPDEWLNLAFTRKVTEAIAHLLDAHAAA